MYTMGKRFNQLIHKIMNKKLLMATNALRVFVVAFALIFLSSATFASASQNTEVTNPRVSAANQQEVTYTGKVIDKSTKKPVIGATVISLTTGAGAITDDKGTFSITTAPGSEIEISYLGLKTTVITVNATETNLIIEMESDDVQVDEVVVTGMFKNKKAESFTGSVVTVTAKDLKQFGNRNVLTTLSNLDPSINLVQSNEWGSDPNTIATVTVRGSGSIPNVGNLTDDMNSYLNTPLVIIDGFESSLQTLIDMNENEISTISILKDASATAMYGSRGANGVIVVERVLPEPGKLKFTYRGDMTFQTPDLSSYDLLNASEKLALEYMVGRYDYERPSTDLVYKQQYNYLLSEVNRGVDTDWLSIPLTNAIGQRHSIRIDGGDSAFRYAVSAQYGDTPGVMKDSYRRTFNGDISLSYRTDKFNFSNYTSISTVNSANSPYGTFSEYAAMNPYFSPYDENGKIVSAVGIEGVGASEIFGTSGIANPLYNASLNTFDLTNTLTLTNNFAIEWTIIDGLIATGKLGISKSVGGSDAFYPAEHTAFNSYSSADLIRKGYYDIGENDSFAIDGTINLSYFKTFNEKHTIFAGVNGNLRQSDYSYYSVRVEGFSNEDMDFISMGSMYQLNGSPSGDISTARTVGIVGNFNYSYDDRYFADFTLTGNGNSAFGSNNRFGTFWSAGLGWNIHNESFMKDVTFIDKFKLRGSYGINGSEAFETFQALTTYSYITDTRYGIWMGTDLGQLGNPELKWQTTENRNIGVDLEFMNRRLSASFDVYSNLTKDQISSIALAPSTGFSYFIDNIGEVSNKGFEARVTGQIIRDTRREIIWTVSATAAYNKNTIESLSDVIKEAQAQADADADGYNPYTSYQEGMSMNTIYVVQSLGIDPTTGKEIFIDRYGNPTTTWSYADLTDCGTTDPKLRGNINTNLRYKSWMLAASFGYQFGAQAYNSTLVSKVENVDYNYNVDARVLSDRWQTAGDESQFKALNDVTTTNMSSRFVQDNNIFQLQSLSINYEFKQDWVKEKLGIEYMSLQATMDDVFYWSTIQLERGTSYPFSRQMSMTLNVTF